MVENQEELDFKILWEMATGYDFFSSLHVLHSPGKFGLRGAWAAGVRSRLSAKERDFLEKVATLLPLPYAWVNNLPEPKDTQTILYSLKQIPAEERIAKLFLDGYENSPLEEVIQKVYETRGWDEKDRDQVVDIVKKLAEKHNDPEMVLSPRNTEIILNYFSNPHEFGEKYLDSLSSYNEVFFAEEEKRITPKLEEAVARGKELAKKLAPIDLLEELSRGLRFENLIQVEELLLVPSYWLSPLVTSVMLDKKKMLLLYGGRAAGEALVPGEIVPEDLLKALKALADPTRLRILRYLMQEQLTPAELARRLRLRAPTLSHHLHSLRLAGLVRFVLRRKKEHLYYANMDSIKANYALLKDFLEEDIAELEEVDVLDRGRAA